MKKNENSISYEDVYIGMEVIDKDGDNGIITKIYDSHNIVVEYCKNESNDTLGGSGIYCLEKDCKDYYPLFKNRKLKRKNKKNENDKFIGSDNFPRL